VVEEESADGIGKLELEWQDVMRSQDSQEQLHALLALLDSTKACIQSGATPRWGRDPTLGARPHAGGGLPCSC
jgi:hypothetical protein